MYAIDVFNIAKYRLRLKFATLTLFMLTLQRYITRKTKANILFKSFQHFFRKTQFDFIQFYIFALVFPAERQMSIVKFIN
jgi:hypothetical protein